MPFDQENDDNREEERNRTQDGEKNCWNIGKISKNALKFMPLPSSELKCVFGKMNIKIFFSFGTHICENPLGIAFHIQPNEM